MNQSAISTIFVSIVSSLLVVAASTAQARSVGSYGEHLSLPNRAQVVREWSAGIRSNALRAVKEINREAIQSALTPAALKLEMPMLSDSSDFGTPVAMVTRSQAVSPQAD